MRQHLALVDKRGRRDLKEVSGSIEKKVQSEKLRAELDALKKQSGVWMDDAYFTSKTPSLHANVDPDAPGQKHSTREDSDADKQQK